MTRGSHYNAKISYTTPECRQGGHEDCEPRAGARCVCLCHASRKTLSKQCKIEGGHEDCQLCACWCHDLPFDEFLDVSHDCWAETHNVCKMPELCLCVCHLPQMWFVSANGG